MSAAVCPADVTLARWLTQIGLDYLVETGGQSLFRAAAGPLKVQVQGVPKRDPKGAMHRLAGAVTLQAGTGSNAVDLFVEGEVRTVPGVCRILAAEQDSVIRLGVKPAKDGFTGGTFVGGGNFDFDVTGGDPQALGGVEFWNLEGNLEGTFTVATPTKAAPGSIASINKSQVMTKSGVGRLSGKVGNFHSSTVTARGIFTFSGVATADGRIHTQTQQHREPHRRGPIPRPLRRAGEGR